MLKSLGLGFLEGLGLELWCFGLGALKAPTLGGDRVLISEPSQLPVLFLGVPYYNYSIMGPTTLF